MTDPTTQPEVLRAMRDAHAEMQAFLAALTPEQRLAPVLDDGWSVKDSLAHISAWELMTVGWLEASLRGEDVRRYTPEFVQPDDPIQAERVMNDLNAQLFAENRPRPWDDVLAEFERAHTELAAVVERMSDDDLFNPQRFAWRKGSPAIDMVGGNSYGHYQEHLGYMRPRLSAPA